MNVVLIINTDKKEKTGTKKRNYLVWVLAALCVVISALLIYFKGVPYYRYNSAVEMYEAGNYEQAAEAFTVLGDYKDSNERVCESKYAGALALYEAGDYENAITAFEELGEYKESIEIIADCKTALTYEGAVKLLGDGKITEAYDIFVALDGYKDSESKIEDCRNAYKDMLYNEAVELIESGNIMEAYDRFNILGDYKDSGVIMLRSYELYELEKVKAAKPGDYVLFGSYEQDNNTSNGKEDIEWLVLEKNDNKAYLVSKYALDCRRYNDSELGDTTWESCSIRMWLNNTFFNTAFSPKEQAMIATTCLPSGKNKDEISDKIFLLELGEVTFKYFKTDEERKCVPTAYAIEMGAEYDISHKTANDEPTCWWWLFAPYNHRGDAFDVGSDGSHYYYGDKYIYSDGGSVRPAMWINFDSSVESATPTHAKTVDSFYYELYTHSRDLLKSILKIYKDFYEYTVANPPTPITPSNALYNPGTYIATALGLDKVTMTAAFDENSIVSIDLDVSGETVSIGQAAKDELIKQLLAAQSNEIDGVTGATLTSNAVKRAAADCISQASS